MSKKVSLKDIANKVGVSTAAVSYVLNGLEKEKRVGADVVRQIKQAASELNYKPNQIARSLRKGATSTIGLIVADIANPFFGHLARIIEDEAIRFNYTVIFGSSDESCSKSDSLLDTFLNRQVDGLIMVPSEGCDEQVKSLRQKNIPLVLIDRFIRELETNYVILDNFNAVGDSVTHLVSKGHKRIRLIVYRSSLVHMEERIRGYVRSMTDHGLEDFICVEEVSYHSMNDEMEGVIRRVSLENETDALIFATNALSLAGLYALKKYKVKVPDDLAIVGFDGNEAFDFFDPPVTYIQQPLEEMGQQAVRVLVNQMKGAGEAVKLILKHQLVLRTSCG
ncbi:LacI family DNA-binding transcriptional regulator [Gaoshiqia sp. Z1-71]|uniref:LacI family DNA-binding transcriptional regulator n=1 Tax=Gaoshiqia hydrogeniformans TaxID=3290090 RepID=UPI003BF90EC1